MQTEVKAPVQTAPPPVQRQGVIPGLRWWICGLLFLATTINYIDRTSMSVLKTMLQGLLHLDEAQYGWIMFSFSTAYAVCFPFAGRFTDKMGVKAALAIALVGWSLAAGAHAFVGGFVGFCIVRFFLGAAESVNFPASIKAVAQWFPQKERALATGIFNSGTNVGVMLSVGTVWIATHWGWREAFIAIGVIGFLWLIFWQLLYANNPRQHPRINPAEADHIEGGITPTKEKMDIPWYALLRYKQIWPFLIGKGITDPVWWFYLYWLPSYLTKERGLSQMGSAGALNIPYIAADFGAIFGGWFSGYLIGKNWRVGSARYAAMFLCAVCMPFTIYAVFTGSFWVSLFLISVATSCHQGWSSNIFTTATDLFPSKVAGSVVGLGGMAGGIGSMFLTLLVGMTLQWLDGTTYKYVPIFVWAGLMHPTSLVIFWFMAGRDLKQVDVDKGLDLTTSNTALLVAGSIAVLIGVLVAGLLGLNWEFAVKALKSASGAAGGMTAGVLAALIGAALVYAGMPKKQYQG